MYDVVDLTVVPILSREGAARALWRNDPARASGRSGNAGRAPAKSESEGRTAACEHAHTSSALLAA
jgi:hypothetical protein